jgi:hypothetical protein
MELVTESRGRAFVKALGQAKPDSVEMFYGFLPAMAGYAAFVMWAGLIVRAIRGEPAREDWRVLLASTLFLATRTLVSGTHVRESLALRASVVEMRGLLSEGAQAAERRDQRDAERSERLRKLTIALVALAGMTLAAAIVTLIVTVV